MNLDRLGGLRFFGLGGVDGVFKRLFQLGRDRLVLLDPRDDVLRFLARLDEAREVVNVGLLIGAKSALGFLGRRCHLLIASNDRVDVVSVATSAATATTHGRWVAAIAL